MSRARRCGGSDGRRGAARGTWRPRPHGAARKVNKREGGGDPGSEAGPGAPVPGRRGGGGSHLPPERGRRGGGSPGSPLPPPPSPPPGFASAIAPLRSPPAPPSSAPGCMVHGARAPLRRSSGRSRVLSAAAAERWVKDPPGPPAAARPIEGGPGALPALRDPPPRAGGRRPRCPRAAGGEQAGWRGDQARPRRAGAANAWRVRDGRSPAGPFRFLRPHVADPGPASPACRGAGLRSQRSGAEIASRQAEVGHLSSCP